MKHFLLTLLFLISGVHLQAFNLARESWTENTPKTGSVVLESSNLVLRSLDGKYGACIYHKRFPTQPGRAYRLTVKASGNGVLEAGLYLYGTEKGFLGRVPLPMKAVHFRSSEPHTTVYFLEIPPGKYNGKEVPAFFRPCLRVPTGELRLFDASLEETAPLPKAMNHLDESHSVKGEQLPFFSEPNLLNSSYETWDCRGGDAIYTEKGFLLSTRNEFSTAMAVSPPIRVQQGKKYLLTGLYHTGDAAYGSFGSIRILPVGQVGKYRQNPDVQLFSSFQGRELYNREPGEWIRLSLSYTPPADVKEVCVAVIQNGAPCHVNWSSFYFGLGPWEKDSRNRAYDWKRYVNTYDPLFEMEKVREILLKREPAKLEVRNSSSPGLFLNGHSLPPLIYFGDFNRPERSKLQDFQKAGVNLQIIVLGRGQNIWRGNGDYNFAGMDELIWSNVRRNPAGTFLVLLDCSPYQKWALEFPGEVALDHAGKPAVSRHGRKGVPCYWSPLYRRQVAEFIHKAVTHMRGQLYFRAIGGFFLSGNEDGQFYYQIVRDGLLEDGNSPGALPEFRRWLRARYGSVQKLQRAWNKPGVRFETAVPPVPKRIQGNFFDPATEMPQIDLTRFLNESMGDFANLMCRTAKTAAGKPVVAIMWWGRGGSMMVYPHYAQTAKIFPSRDLDLMGAQPGYQGERNAACSNFFSWIPDSARLHGKITMIEADFRTWTSPVNSLLHDYRVARFWNHGELRLHQGTEARREIRAPLYGQVRQYA